MTADRFPMVPGLTGLSVLARGGYATVFRATQQSVGRLVAVKVENRLLESERDQRRFMREARAAGRMSSHPHVVDLFDAGVTTSGHPYLIMELCRGSYSERMRMAPLSPHEARDVGIKIADALADAHALGVLHRDVKPANILVTDFGEPALADFGLAILTENRDISITLDVLTPAYAPPEMFRHAPPAPAADVYSLCATLYALMAGRPPRWPGSRDPSLVSLVDMFDQAIPDLPHVPRELMALVLYGMANTENERPSAGEVRDVLVAMDLGPPPRLESWATGLPAGNPAGSGLPAGNPAGSGLPAGNPAGSGLPGQGPAAGGSPLPVPVPDGGGSPAPAPPMRADGDTRVVRAAQEAREARERAAAGQPAWDVLGGEPNRGAAAGRPAAPTTGKRPAAYLWAGIAAIYVAVLCAAIAAALYLAPEDAKTTFVAPSVAPSPPCPLTPAGTAQCVRTAECFDRVTVTGGVARAATVACTEPHLWEAFATAQLPSGLDNASHASIKQNAQVRQVCSTTNARLLNTEQTWQVEVLPPTRDQVKAGDRTYRCLAGRPPTKLTQSRFVR